MRTIQVIRDGNPNHVLMTCWRCGKEKRWRAVSKRHSMPVNTTTTMARVWATEQGWRNLSKGWTCPECFEAWYEEKRKALS